MLIRKLQETAYDLALATIAGTGTGAIASIYFMDGLNWETVSFCALSFATYSTIDKWARLHPRKHINRAGAIINGSKGRAIPLGTGGHLFMNSIKIPFQAQQQAEPIPEATEYQAIINGLPYTVTRGELENFLYTAWKRQRSNKPGLSRNYWTKSQRLQRELYEARILILEQSNLIMDRGERRSGRLSLPPQMAIEQVNQRLN